MAGVITRFGVVGLLVPAVCSAIMAGASPDSPDARVDPNTAASSFSGVVALEVNGSVYSGVLINRRHVLTAGHVADANTPVTVVFNAGRTLRVAVVRVIRHPDYLFPNNDLSVLELAADAPPEAIAYAIGSSTPTPGLIATLVGYGDSGYGNAGYGVARNATVKRWGRNALDSYDLDAATNRTVRFYFDFDGPTGATNYSGGRTLGNAIETTLLGGDSGCAVLAQQAGDWTLVGLGTMRGSFSGGPQTPGTFGTWGGGQWLPGYIDWITATAGPTGESTVVDGDAPLPAWAAGVLAVALMFVLRRSHRSDEFIG